MFAVLILFNPVILSVILVLAIRRGRQVRVGLTPRAAPGDRCETQPGCIPLAFIAAAADGPLRNLMNAFPAGPCFEPAPMPAAKTE